MQRVASQRFSNRVLWSSRRPQDDVADRIPFRAESHRTIVRFVAVCLLLLTSGLATVFGIEPPPAGDPAPPQIAGASSEGADALKGFRLHEGWRGELFAAEPRVANPVSFFVDHRGRVFVCESFRQNRGVTDNRGHDQAWVDDDLAAQTVEDRLAYHLKHLGDRAAEYTKYDDRIRLIEDRDGDGEADTDTVFADRFNELVDGSGAGVLVRGDDVYFTCIPHLWQLQDDDGDGRSDERRALSSGYGVRVAFRGHDLHGLTLGPDGMLYFSVGDRGYNIQTPNGRLVNPESGAVFRCELDGTGLEVFATGLRNPQELAFDEHGNLFTGDNNSDSGDRARWVYLIEGGDSGWRMAYQYLPDRGPFNREKIWHPHHDRQPAYIVPPVTNFADGPSGLAYYPGTGLGDDWRGRFLLCDFRGGPANSGVRSFRMKPSGAFFELVDATEPIWNVLATDVQFGPDGSIYVSDWVNGWNGEGKGRIYRFFDPTARGEAAARETAELLAAGMHDRSADELAKLLSHADQRVRLESQLELADRREAAVLASVARESADRLARLHAIWGLGQIARRRPQAGGEPAEQTLAPVVALLDDEDGEVRAQAASIVGRAKLSSGRAKLVALLADDEPRVRMFAALSLGKLGADEDSVAAVAQMLADNDGADPILRHAGMMALAGAVDAEALEPLYSHANSAVRIALAVALRRRGETSVARLLNDADPLVVVEAARAIHDEPIDAAAPQLASLIARPADDEALVRRVLNANFRLGGDEQLAAIARFAVRADALPAMRMEAIRMIEAWPQPSSRDRVLGMWRPLKARERAAATDALKRVLPAALAAPNEIRNEAIRVAASLGIAEIGPALHQLLNDAAQPERVRADAIGALAAINDSKLDEAIAESLKADSPHVRHAARRALAARRPDEALPLLSEATRSEERIERQGAFAALAELKNDEADRILESSLADLTAGRIPADTRLDVVTAINSRAGDVPSFRRGLAKYNATIDDDSLVAFYRDAVSGGDSERGRRIFFERAEVSCVRCHKVDSIGGEVGPDLSKIAHDKSREYLLESVVDPSKTIAKGFESALIVDENGRTYVGVVKRDDDQAIELITAEGKVVSIPKEAIELRRATKSAMPEDLLKHLSPIDVRDLVEFLSARK